MRVRKKPVVIDGWPIADLLGMAARGIEVLPREVREAYQAGHLEFEKDRITISTLEGVMTGWEGSWLMRGIEGEWYPCEGDIFHKTYDLVEPTDVGIPVKFPTIDPYGNSPEV